MIYYARHGTEMPPPANWETSGPSAKIQAIVPYDCDIMKSSQNVAPIPSPVIEALLSKVAEKKGNNIVRVRISIHQAV